MRFNSTNNIKRILVITLSNLGDVILTTPVIEVLLRAFPGAKIDVTVGPNGKEVFEKHPKISELIIYDKFQDLISKLKLISRLRKKRYSMAVDLRNTFIPYLIGVPHKSLPFKKLSRHIPHKKDIHLWKLKALGVNISNPPYRLYIDDEDRKHIDNMLKALPAGRLVAINAGAKSYLKKWQEEGFAYIINKLNEEPDTNVVMIGSPEDGKTASSIMKKVDKNILNLAGKTTVRQLIALIEKVDLLITNDTAPMHVASILNKKTLAIFGPTDFKEYGPFGRESIALQKPVVCAPCRKAHCFFDHECMRFLKKERVFEVARAMLEGKRPDIYATEPKRILLARTDRIGDVVLSTPAIKAVYDNYINSFISFMVQPYTEDVVKGNPYLDEVIVFDKNKLHKGVLGTLKLTCLLRQRKFDMALVLHPTNRAHIVTFLAGIPKRIGYDKKMGFLLTKRIPHAKQLGEKHESEYTLDVLKAIGITPRDKKPFIPIDGKVEEAVREKLLSGGIKDKDIIVCIHPGASCPSKRWDPAKFAEVGNKLVENFNAKIAVISGPSDVELGNKVASLIKNNVINLSGALLVRELAPLLKKCAVFLSNDSGPVHIAAAVGTPVISIFGRNERGLSPTRWRPLGENSMVIHKDVGCKECLAHNCKINFKCLRGISVDEVLDAVYKFKDRLKK